MSTEASIRCGKRIREAREAKGWTQAQLARELPGKTDSPSVSRWERGVVLPGPENVEALARVLERDYAYFVVPDAPAETPDLMGALSPDDSTTSVRLDRLEEKVDAALAILRRLEAAADQGPPGELGQIAGGSPPKPPRPEQDHSEEEPDDQRDTG
ncbi:MAG: helix-turn-helix domain-containing protein [Solirubrobacteraceae bacterium]